MLSMSMATTLYLVCCALCVWWLQLYIHAYDQGSPLSLTSEIEILCITVEDINDRAPTFSPDDVSTSERVSDSHESTLPSQAYSVMQDEGSIPQSAIIHIVATDNDAGTNAHISYSITSGNTSLFSINEVCPLTLHPAAAMPPLPHTLTGHRAAVPPGGAGLRDHWQLLPHSHCQQLPHQVPPQQLS